MNCKTVNTNLSSFIEGNLPFETQQEIAIHLNSCSQCKHQLQVLKSVLEEVENEKSELIANPFLAQKIWSMAEPMVAPIIPLRAKTIVTIAAAGLAIGFIIGSLTNNFNSNSIQSSDQTWEQLAEDYFPSDNLSPYDNFSNNQ